MADILRMPASKFVQELTSAKDRKDGYIMGATGQNPRNWSVDSWWFNQYTGKQYDKAIYWRINAQRVWDCNGMAEGLYKDFSSVNINTKARYNYAQWCDPKGEGMIPTEYRVPGAAVFWSNTSSPSDIHHVAYLVKPVKEGNPSGDWYLIEAAGVMSGVVQSKLIQRNPNFWGWMTKYFDYGMEFQQHEYHLGDRILRSGMAGTDVKELQECLIELGYDCGRWGADGEFGDATDIAVKKFQKDKRLEVDGIVGPKTVEALSKAMASDCKPIPNARKVVIFGGNCYVRSAPNTSGAILGVAKNGEEFDYQWQTTEDGWNLIAYKMQNGWVSGKYSKVKK